MPDDTPAEVKMSPSRTKIASGSTVISGKARANNRGVMPVRGGAPAVEQAGLREDERPRANRGQTPGPGRDRLDRRRRARGRSLVAGKLSLPATTTVSADSIDEMASVTPSRVPIEVVTSRPSTDAILSW